MECGHSGVCLKCANTITHGQVDYTTGGVSGGSGTCPVCRAPVMHVLRVGCDMTTVDGRTVAFVLPSVYWSYDRDSIAAPVGEEAAAGGGVGQSEGGGRRSDAR